MDKAKQAYDLLLEIRGILQAQHEDNWMRGINAAVSELSNASDKDTGYENARSIYTTMTAGGRGFAEYSIWIDDGQRRADANRRLDELRGSLWQLFES